MADELTGLILAGGQSRRFGSDKALAEIDGVSFIGRVYEALAPLCTEVLVSVGINARTYPLPGPARFITDRTPDAGPIAGLEAGLAEAWAPWTLAVACDLPFMTSDVLLSVADMRHSTLEAVVGSTPAGQLQPLCSCYHQSVLPTLRGQLRRREYALHKLVRLLRTQTASVPASALRNVNTLDDLTPGARL